MEYPHIILVHQPGGIELVHLAEPGSITHLQLTDEHLETIRQERPCYRRASVIATDPATEKEVSTHGA